jgi:hypothetical protein
MKGGIPMKFGTLSLTHEIIGKLYEVAFNLTDDNLYTKEVAVESIQEIIKQMDELTEIIRCKKN